MNSFDEEAFWKRDEEMRAQQEQAAEEKQKRYQHKEKKSFIIYHDWLTYLECLPDDALVGRLFKALFAFAVNGEIVDLKEPAANMALRMMTAQFGRDAEKYENKCKKNAENRAKQEEYKRQKEAERQSSTTVDQIDR